MQIEPLNDLVARIPNGARLAIPVSRSGVAMAATRALILQKVRDLHLIAVPTSGIQADILIGAGAVATVESAGITLDEHGQAGRFVAAAKAGSLGLLDSTCPAIIAGIQAAEKGVPFLPIRGLIGSDLMSHRPDYQVIGNPFAAGNDPIVLVPAIQPDIAMFHAPIADRFGNVWIGKMRELMTMAHAAKETFVTVEKVVEHDLMQDELYAPAMIPSLYISGLSIAENGAHPLGLEGCYAPDSKVLPNYATAAKTDHGFAEFLSNWLHSDSER